MAADIIGMTQCYPTLLKQIVMSENESVTFNYVGEYNDIIRRAPNKDVVWNEDGRMWTVLNSTVIREPGGMAELQVVCIPYQVGRAGAPTSDRWEIQFVETSQPLAFHKKFKQLPLQEWQKFLASPEFARCENKYCPDPSDESITEDLPNSLVPWASLYNKGIEEFAVYLPVVIRVRTYELSPKDEVTDVGKRIKPKYTPSGYSGSNNWLKTGDNFVQEGGSGKWTRTETWTYAEEWPELLYD